MLSWRMTLNNSCIAKKILINQMNQKVLNKKTPSGDGVLCDWVKSLSVIMTHVYS